MSDESTPQIPAVERGPRQPGDHEYTGTGTPRSADDGMPEAGAMGDRDAPADPAVVVGATTSSHSAESADVAPNRSGSGGSGGPATAEGTTDGSQPVDMEDLLAGDPEGGAR